MEIIHKSKLCKDDPKSLIMLINYDVIVVFYVYLPG